MTFEQELEDRICDYLEGQDRDVRGSVARGLAHGIVQQIANWVLSREEVAAIWDGLEELGGLIQAAQDYCQDLEKRMGEL